MINTGHINNKEKMYSQLESIGSELSIWIIVHAKYFPEEFNDSFSANILKLAQNFDEIRFELHLQRKEG
jgi:hypothetical protein